MRLPRENGARSTLFIRKPAVTRQPFSTVSVMLPLAVAGPYTYAVGEAGALAPGDLVEVPLGPRHMLGVVWDDGAAGTMPVPQAKLRAVTGRLPARPIPETTRRFVDWVAAYSLSLPGMVLRMVLRSAEALQDPRPQSGVCWQGGEPERRTAARARVLEVAGNGLAWVKRDLAAAAGVSPGVVDGLIDQGVLESIALPPAPAFEAPDPDHAVPQLNDMQKDAAHALRAAVATRAFSVTLLEGVTGSGKTEVYFEAVAEALRQGRQALVLLPEIALTSQFLERFAGRFAVAPAEWHSGITSRQRETVWRAVHRGEVRVVIGARSALFLPFADLALIVVDEEHEPAYKQDDGVLYNARDMAVVRGRLGCVPVILASATPSIETRVNVESGRYARIVLPSRFAARPLPHIDMIDLRCDPPERGKWLSPVLIGDMRKELDSGGQVLLFLNRRGYAPLTLCRACGHRFMCPDCSAWLVEHRFRGRLACHHCGFSMPVPKACPSCGAADSLTPCGPGVERIAEEVAELFPDRSSTILSSDLIAGVGEMRARLSDIAAQRYDIVVGTQLIAKGHHFPGLTLVGVVDGDLGLAHGDLRAAERTYQLLHQVVGRAGRGEKPGRGVIQTHLPDHGVMQALASGDEETFYREEIAARRHAGLPPFGRLAALIVSGRDKERAFAFARQLARTAPADTPARVLGPAEAPLALVRGRYRFRLLVKAPRGFDLQSWLRAWLSAAGEPKGGVRLAVDIDPYSFL